jgi:hypothetical protein
LLTEALIGAPERWVRPSAQSSRRRLTDALAASGVPRPRVTVATVKTLPRDPHSGKARPFRTASA